MRNQDFKYDALYSRCERTLKGASVPKRPSYSFRGQDSQPPSLQTMECNTAPPRQGVYTGSAMLGVATMHKSNAVPVFQEQDAKDISNMRR